MIVSTVSKSKFRMNLNSVLRSRVLFIIVFGVLTLLIIDVSIVRIATYTGGMYPVRFYLEFYTILVITFSVVSFLLLKFVGAKSRESNAFQRQPIKIVFRAVPIIQCTIIVLLFAIVIQMTIGSFYSLDLLKAIVYTSYSVGGIIMAILSLKFLNWLRINRNMIVFLYMLATAMISCNAFVSVLYLEDLLKYKSSNIRYSRSLSASCCPSYDAYSKYLVEFLNYSFIMSFSLTWIASALLLRNYSNKRSMIRFWILIALPMIYFMGSFQYTVLDMFAEIRMLNPQLFDIGYTLFFGATRPVGGILFGIAFWNAAKNTGSSIIRNYLMISAYAMMICFASNQLTSLSATPYPPFGTISVAFFGLGSFLMLVGIYASAIAVSQDITLIKLVKSKARQLGLLEGIGISQMRGDTEQLVKKVMSDVSSEMEDLEKLSGITTSLGEDDFKNYLNMVINETKKK